MTSLTELYRPKEFKDMTGNQRLTGPNGILTRMANEQNVRSCIFYGPPGCGKTTSAKILAKKAGLPLYLLNATQTGTKELKAIADENKEQSVLIYMDEIQYFNKKQQQVLLPYVESGQFILIASTSENPYHGCNDALLSRCLVLEFKPLTSSDIEWYLKKIPEIIKNVDTTAIEYIATSYSGGDLRRCLILLDLALEQYPNEIITTQHIKNLLPSVTLSAFDKDSDVHYALVSALQKSIRGSDPNAAVYYLARLLEGGDLESPCRRLLVIANEDIGLADPNAVPFTLACVECAKRLGLAEADKPLTNAVLYLAIAPKSSTCETTYFAAKRDVLNGKGANIPPYLRNAHATGYLYPHNYPHHYVKQQYLPDDLKQACYYTPGDNVFEQSRAEYWKHIMQS